MQTRQNGCVTARPGLGKGLRDPSQLFTLKMGRLSSPTRSKAELRLTAQATPTHRLITPIRCILEVAADTLLGQGGRVAFPSSVVNSSSERKDLDPMYE